jgi:hypothetical protein
MPTEPSITLILLTLLTTYSLVGVIAVWGALGHGHWFFRMAAVLLFLAAWLLAADDRLCLLFLAQSTVVVLRLSYARAREAQRQIAAAERPLDRPAARPIFSLLDLLLAVVLLSGVLAMLVRLRAGGYSHWLQDILPGAALGCFTLVAVWAARSTSNVWLRMAVLVVCLPSLLMGVWLWLAQRARAPAGRVATAIGLALIAVLPLRLYYLEVATKLRSYPSPLADNGYYDLLRAAESIDEAATAIDKLSGDKLRRFVIKHRQPLALAESAVARPCQSVLPDGMSDNTLMAEYHGIENLAHALAAQGRLQLADEEPLKAAKSCLAAIQLGAGAAKGGVMAHDWFDLPCEQAGVEGLQPIIAHLNDDDCRELCQRLVVIEAEREPIENAMAREKFYLKKAYPWKYRPFPLLGNFKMSYEDALWGAISGLKLARLRLLVCHLALRRAKLAAGDYPDRLQALVPRYLAEIPCDPFGNGALVYRKRPGGYQLYSIGIDLRDDGGRPMTPLTGRPLPKGDVVVDPILPAD